MPKYLDSCPYSCTFASVKTVYNRYINLFIVQIYR